MSDPDHRTRSAIARGIGAWDQDDFESALVAFREVLERHPRYADVHNKIGLCFAMMDDYGEALRHFDSALDINAGYAEAHLNRAIILRELGQHEEAEESFERAQKLDSQNWGKFPAEVGNRLAIMHAQLGDLYLVAGRPERAAQEYAAGLELRPSFVDIRSKYAEALLALGRADEARRELEAILSDQPGFVGARVRMGVVLSRMGDEEGARREWERCAEEAPEDLRPRAYLTAIDAIRRPEPS